MPSRHSKRKALASIAKQTRSARQTTPKNGRGRNDSTDQEEEDEDEATPSAPRHAELPPSPATPTTKSTRNLANLALGTNEGGAGATQGNLDDDAVEAKYADLVAQGWRPEEELASVGDDDDDGYAGLDSISVSDDDEHAIRRFEADSLISRRDARRLSLQSEDMDVEWHGFDDPLTPRIDPMTGSILGGQDHEPASFLLNDARNDTLQDQDRKVSHVVKEKAVRFDVDSDASSATSDSEDDYDDMYLFSQVAAHNFDQPHGFGDVPMDEEGSEAGSEWDYQGADDFMEHYDDDSDDDTSDASANSSGYDSDDEELTDEEDLAGHSSLNTSLTLANSSSLEHIHNTPAKPVIKAEPQLRVTRAKAKKVEPEATPKQRFPKMGTFEVDPRRPMLVVSGAGAAQRNQFVAARIQTPDEKKFWRRMKNSSVTLSANSKTSVQLDPADEMEMLEEGSLFGAGSPFPSLRNVSLDQEYIGPSAALTPFTSIDASGARFTDTPMLSGDDEDDRELAAISPFVNWDKFDEDEDEDEDEDDSQDTSDVLVEYSPRKRANTMPAHGSPSSGAAHTPSLSRRSTANSDQNDDILAHLKRDNGLVNAFRMNQHYVKHYTSYAAHPSTRASTLEVNAMQSGRRKWGNTPITPLRKRRGGSLGKIGKLDWSKGLVTDSTKPSAGQFKRPMSAGNGSVRRPPTRGGVYN